MHRDHDTGFVRDLLLSLNNQILAAEQSGKPEDVAFLKTVIDDTLLFRRADGSLADKTTFLDNVSNAAQRLKNRQASAMQVDILGRSAVVTLIVSAVGEKDGKSVARKFKNIRFFVERDGIWLLEHWYNEETVS